MEASICQSCNKEELPLLPIECSACGRDMCIKCVGGPQPGDGCVFCRNCQKSTNNFEKRLCKMKVCERCNIKTEHFSRYPCKVCEI